MYPFFKMMQIIYGQIHLGSELEYLHQWKKTWDYGCQVQCVSEALGVIFNLHSLGTTAENSEWWIGAGGSRLQCLNRSPPNPRAITHTYINTIRKPSNCQKPWAAEGEMADKPSGWGSRRDVPQDVAHRTRPTAQGSLVTVPGCCWSSARSR